MTTLAALVGADQRGENFYRPCSLYLASDSRISWQISGRTVCWDSGRKVFASRTRPDLLAYVGDVFFPSLALAQIISAIDANALYPENASPLERFSRITMSLKKSFGGLPVESQRGFTIVYATRESEKLDCTFHMFTLTWSPKGGWSEESLDVPHSSSSLLILGSGEAAVEKWQKRWHSSTQGGTSRAIFSAFCNAISSGQDPRSGGAPQLVGLYRIGPGRAFGIVHDDRPFVFGMQMDEIAAAAATVEWRNTVFERCDFKGDLLPDAKRHHVPRGLRKKA
jgi:hypothetical protein